MHGYLHRLSDDRNYEPWTLPSRILSAAIHHGHHRIVEELGGNPAYTSPECRAVAQQRLDQKIAFYTNALSYLHDVRDGKRPVPTTEQAQRLISGAEGISEEAVELVERWILWAKLSRGAEASVWPFQP